MMSLMLCLMQMPVITIRIHPTMHLPSLYIGHSRMTAGRLRRGHGLQRGASLCRTVPFPGIVQCLRVGQKCPRHWISGGSGDANITSSWNYMKIAAQAAIASSWWTGRTATSLNAVEIGKTLLVPQLASSPRANVVERALANQIIASNPGAVVASMARDYINKGSQNGGVCRDIVADYNLVNVLNDLAYAYDWFYNDPAAMSDADQVTIRKAIESSLKTVMYQGGIVYNTYDGVSERCDTSDPETAYPDGKTVGGSSIWVCR